MKYSLYKVEIAYASPEGYSKSEKVVIDVNVENAVAQVQNTYNSGTWPYLKFSATELTFPDFNVYITEK